MLEERRQQQLKARVYNKNGKMFWGIETGGGKNRERRIGGKSKEIKGTRERRKEEGGKTNKMVTETYVHWAVKWAKLKQKKLIMGQ